MGWRDGSFSSYKKASSRQLPMRMKRGVIVEEGSRYKVTKLLAPTICSAVAISEVTGGERSVRRPRMGSHAT